MSGQESLTMGVKEAIESRRAIKGFDPQHRMSDAEIQTLLANGFLSPTAFNIQHWRVVNVVDRELRKKIRAAAWEQPQVTDASLLLVLCMVLKAWGKNPGRYWQGVDQEVLDFILPRLKAYYDEKEQVQRDECMRSCGIFAMALMLTAQEMGYDSCPMDGFDFDEVGGLINLPDDHIIGMMLAVGKKISEPHPRVGKLPVDELLLVDSF